MPKPPKSWKAFELRVARLLGGKRRGADYGGRQGGKCDIIHDSLAPECKLLKKPTWGQLTDALAQASASTDANEGRLPVAIMKENHRGVPDGDSVVLMWLDDFRKLFGEPRDGETKDGEADGEGAESNQPEKPVY